MMLKSTRDHEDLIYNFGNNNFELISIMYENIKMVLGFCRQREDHELT